jgi:hypothetical protein
VENEDTGMLEEGRVEEIVMDAVADLIEKDVRFRGRPKSVDFLARRDRLHGNARRELSLE